LELKNRVLPAEQNNSVTVIMVTEQSNYYKEVLASSSVLPVNTATEWNTVIQLTAKTNRQF